MHCYLFLLLPRPLRRQAGVFDTPQNMLALAEELSQKPVAIETAMSLHDLIGSGVQALAGDEDPTSQTLLAELRKRKQGVAGIPAHQRARHLRCRAPNNRWPQPEESPASG